MVSYSQAGVNIDHGNELVTRLKTMCPDIGGFSGLFPIGDDYLVASTDGVGTKLKLAFELNFHETIGIDLVAMCVNDIITTGASPLFLLDYFATSKLDVDKAEKVLQGVLQGCREAGCALLGGETAEMPGFFNGDEYDIAGFTVGIVKKDDLINGKSIQEGDLIVGIPSSGVHSNGYSLVRKIISDSQTSLHQRFGNSELSLGEELLKPTHIYVRNIQEILSQFKIKGLSHITGGGLTENVPRMLPDGIAACIHKNSWPIPPIFRWLQEQGNVDEEEMYRVFNMGIGMVMVLESSQALELCKQRKDCLLIGEAIQGGNTVIWA